MTNSLFHLSEQVKRTTLSPCFRRWKRCSAGASVKLTVKMCLFRTIVDGALPVGPRYLVQGPVEQLLGNTAIQTQVPLAFL